MNSITLLTSELLKNANDLKYIDYWLRVMNRAQGWHYDLDLIWILENLDQNNIKKGSTILDAGGGLGIAQFVLASKGFNVISLDFSPREMPLLAKGIFEINFEKQTKLNYEHDYIGFVDYEGDSSKSYDKNKSSVLKKIFKILKYGPMYGMALLNQKIKIKRNLYLNTIEKHKNHDGFGSIKFIRAAFHEIPLADQNVDALISVSAIEHADFKLLKKNIEEMTRVVKKGKPLLITTSATGENQKWFHKKTKGWCFDQSTLEKYFHLDFHLDFKKAEKDILNSGKWRKRIDNYYALDPKTEFFKRKIKKLPYLPIGIKIFNE